MQGRQLPHPDALGIQPLHGQAEMRQLCEQAWGYVIPGAWQSLHDLLWPHLEAALSGKDLPPEGAHALSLLLGACLRLGHQDHLACGCAQLCRALSETPQPDAETVVLANIVLAKLCMKHGDYAATETRIAAIPAWALERAHPWSLAALALLRGRIALEAGDVCAAEGHALETVRWAQQGGSEPQLGNAYALLALAAQQRGLLWEASALNAKAATHYWQCGDARSQASVLVNRATALGIVGQFPEATGLYEEALRLATSLQRPHTACRARLGLAWLDLRAGGLAAARSKLLRAWREARRLGLPREQALALEYLAETYTLAGHQEQAYAALRLCKRLVEPTAAQGDIAVEIKVHEAMLGLSEGRIREPLLLARQAIREARRADMPWEEAQARRILAVAHLEEGRTSEARISFQAALQLLDRMGEQLESEVIRAWLRALNRHLRGRRTDRAATESDRRPGAESGGNRWSSQSRSGKLLGTLTFWLDHPLLGPRSWSRGERLCRRTPDVSKPAIRRVDFGAGRRRRPPGRERTHDVAPRPAASRFTGGGVAEMLCRNRPVWSDLGLVTCTDELLRVLEQAETYAKSELPILILGETGTGKDLLAQGIHRLSERPGRFVSVNCAVASRELFVAELFGARRGAYTGSVEDRHGLVQEADRGTIFFDEIADLVPEAQGFLLRFLDSGEVRPLGETSNRLVRARVIAATCRDLPELAHSGSFRRDLYGRLAGTVLSLPALRERIMDLGLLVEMLWSRVQADGDGLAEVFTTAALDALMSRGWPENVRELKHAVQRAVITYRVHGVAAARADLLRSPVSVPDPCPATGATSGRETAIAMTAPNSPRVRHWQQKDWDPAVLEDALHAAHGFVPEAARILGISRSHAYRIFRDRVASPQTPGTRV